MCFRPPTAEMNSPVCPKCGHENFIGVMVCSECGSPLQAGPVGTQSAGSRDWTPGLEFKENAAPTGAAAPAAPAAPKAPGAPAAPAVPGAPKPPMA